MTFIVIVLAAILILTPGHIFKTPTETTRVESIKTSSRVKAGGGLSIRSEPNVHSAVLATAPNHATLTIIDENAATDNIGGTNGNWYKVEYQGVTGYAWGNFIEK